MTASLWKVLVTVGEAVKVGQTLAILEAMKMEIRKRERFQHAKTSIQLALPCSCSRR